MSPRVDANPQALERLKQSLLEFYVRQSEQLANVSLAVVRSELGTRHAIEVWERRAQQLEVELRACQVMALAAIAAGQPPVDCGPKARDLDRARENLSGLHRRLRNLQEMAARWHAAERHCREFSDASIRAMCSGLEARKQSLEAYLSWSAPKPGPDRGGGMHQRSSGIPMPVERKEGNEEALSEVAEGMLDGWVENTRQLDRVWRECRDGWHDDASAHFEQAYMDPLEAENGRALLAAEEAEQTMTELARFVAGLR